MSQSVEDTSALDSAADDDVAAAKAGDESAFRRLYQATQPGLARYIRVLVGSDAEDVCSEAWLQACRDLSRFQGGVNDFRAWIARIARNRAIDLLRTQRRRPLVPIDSAPVDEGVAPSAEEDLLQAISTEDAIRLIASLPQDQAEAVMLRAVMGLDAPTAGKVLGKRAGAVRTASYRGLRTLAKKVLPEDG